MPYNYAHALVGLYVEDTCSDPDAVGIVSNRSAFYLGTMGPDPYYGDAYLPPFGTRARVDLADRLHALDGRKLFSALLSLSEGNAVRTAYTYGLLCHFLLDNRAHPYIESRFPGKAHTPAEIAMDLPLAALYEEPRLNVPPRAFYSVEHVMEIDALHTALFWKLFALCTQGVYARSLHKWLRLNTISYDPSGRKYKLLRPFCGLTRYLVTAGRGNERALLNLDCAPWESGRGVSTESVPVLLDEAKREAVACIDAACGGNTACLLDHIKERNADAAENLHR